MRQYLAIDQKSYYASVECVERGLDPMTTDLVVADAERSKNTICLAVSPHLKAQGVKNRCRLGEIPPNLNYIIAPPRMRLYIEYAAEIHGVFLKYIAPEDIFTYSIDESFLDVTNYLKMYGMTARQLAKAIIADISATVGTVSTCGIGTNLYLAKVALDIQAKHTPDFLGELDEESYRRLLWDHRPLTDFWRIGPGIARRLSDRGITTMGAIAQTREELLYRIFGIDAELLIDHAWGREPTTIADIKAYKSDSKSLSTTQVLMRDYRSEEGEIVAKEMAEQLCLDLAAQKLVTDSVNLFVGYTHSDGLPGVSGMAKLGQSTSAACVIVPAVAAIYRRIVDTRASIRRIGIGFGNVAEDEGALQLNLFEDVQKQLKNKAIQETMLEIRAKYGKNSILKGTNFQPAATGRQRNMQIGGHKSGTENGVGTHAPIPAGKAVRHV